MTADRTPAPVPPAALEAAWEAFAGDGIPRPFELARIRRVVEAAAPFFVAAGRTAAAADIRGEADNTAAVEGGPDLMRYAADIAEGTDHAG